MTSTPSTAPPGGCARPRPGQPPRATGRAEPPRAPLATTVCERPQTKIFLRGHGAPETAEKGPFARSHPDP